MSCIEGSEVEAGQQLVDLEQLPLHHMFWQPGRPRFLERIEAISDDIESSRLLVDDVFGSGYIPFLLGIGIRPHVCILASLLRFNNSEDLYSD